MYNFYIPQVACSNKKLSNQHFFLSIKFTISWTFQYWIPIDFPIFIILHSSILNLSFFIIPQDFQCHSRNMLAWFKRIRFLVQSFSINAIPNACSAIIEIYPIVFIIMNGINFQSLPSDQGSCQTKQTEKLDEILWEKNTIHLIDVHEQ